MKRDEDCIFCKVIAGDIPCFKVYEDDDTLSFMDINPANEGHALVIPKTHTPNVFEIPDDAVSAVARTVAKVARAVESALSPDGLNLVQANGPGAAQSVHHFHMHIVPRLTGDELKLNWGPTPGDMKQIEACCERIRASL